MARPCREHPWLQKRQANGVWYACWYDPKERRTKQFSLRTRDPEEAQVEFGRFLTEGRDIIRGIGRTAVLTVEQAIDDYLEEHVRHKVLDARRTRDCLAPLKAFFGDRPLAEIDETDCREYARMRRNGEILKPRRIKESTVRLELSRLRTVANHAIRKKRLSSDDQPTIELPGMEQRKAPWLTKEEIQALFDAAVDIEITGIATLADFIGICYPIAARRRVVEGLTWGQVDMANWQIHLAEEGWKPTRKRRPTVPIFDEMVPILMKLQARRISDHVFGEPVDVYEPMMRAGRRTGLKSNPHILRHSRATHLLQDGADIYSVARLLGDNVTTVDRVYGHHSPASMREKLSGFSSALAGPRAIEAAE